MLSRGKAMLFWLADALLLFGVGSSNWRDLVSRPAGTIVHVLVTGNELVPWLKTLALLSALVAVISLFTGRVVILFLTTVTGLFAFLVFIATFGKLGAGPAQVGVTSNFFPLPAVGALIGIAGVLCLVLLTQRSVGKWSMPRYRAAGKATESAPIDLWRAQDAGIDPTAGE